MRAKASLYVRPEGSFEPVRLVKGRPHDIPKNYDGPFYVRFTDNGQRKWASFSSFEAAFAQLQNIGFNIDRKREGLLPETASVVPTAPTVSLAAKSGRSDSIANACAAFLAECEGRVQAWRDGDANGLAPSSVAAYKRAINNFAKSCEEFGATRMSEFQDSERGAAILKNHRLWLQANTDRRVGKAAYSDARQFTVLNRFLAGHGIKLAKSRTVNPNDAGLLKHFDVPKVRKPGKGDVVFYTPADLKAMLSACATVNYKQSNNAPLYDPDDLRDLVLILFWTGMRDGELQHLEWSDIIWKDGDASGKILIQDKPQYDWKVKDHEKRSIKMTPKLKTLLLARQKRVQSDQWKSTHLGHSQTLLFSTSVGTPNQNFADFVRGLQERAVLGEVARKNPTLANRKPYLFSRPESRRHILHNFRKTWATWQSIQGVPSQNIQVALGHSELVTTERYLAVFDDDVSQIRANFDAVG
jgi:integrase